MLTRSKLECPFYFPGISDSEYIEIYNSLSKNNNAEMAFDIVRGKIVLKPRKERTKEYIYNILGIEYSK